MLRSHRVHTAQLLTFLTKPSVPLSAIVDMVRSRYLFSSSVHFIVCCLCAHRVRLPIASQTSPSMGANVCVNSAPVNMALWYTRTGNFLISLIKNMCSVSGEAHPLPATSKKCANKKGKRNTWMASPAKINETNIFNWCENRRQQQKIKMKYKNSDVFRSSEYCSQFIRLVSHECRDKGTANERMRHRTGEFSLQREPSRIAHMCSLFRGPAKVITSPNWWSDFCFASEFLSHAWSHVIARELGAQINWISQFYNS